MDDEQVGDFVERTGVSRERARYYLQAAGGDLAEALAAFYDEQDNEEAVLSKKEPSRAEKPSRSGVATLFDFQSQGKGDDEEGQTFYAGGSEHSGQMISGPPRKKKDIAQEVFESAKKHGAVPVEEPSRGKRQPAHLFTGSGFRLGDTEGPSEVVGNPMLAVQQPQNVEYTLVFWKNGFSVNDGPLRDGQSPEDKMFLQSVSRGEIPSELQPASQGGEVNVNMEDKRTELYVPPKPKLVAFSGAGHKLGNLTPEVHGSSAVASSSSSSSSAAVAPAACVLDTSQPVTSLQIRLADGTRLQGKFNHSHTVADIRSYVINSRPDYADKSFVLMTTFPSKELTDLGQSLAQAGLLNSVVVQRMK